MKGNTDRPLNEIVIQVAKELNISINEDKLKRVYNNILNKEYTRNQEEINDKIEEAVQREENNINGHNGVIAGLIEIVIKQNYKQEGKIENAIEILKNELRKKDEHGNLVYQGILSQEEEIIRVLTDIYSENTELLGKSVFDKLKTSKEMIGTGWINKLLVGSNKINVDDMTEGEREYFEKHVGISYLDLDSEYELKPGATDLEAYEVLAEIGNPQLMTYEKAEAMFSGMTRPYSLNFRKWFLQRKEEIMKRPDVCLILSKIHNMFDTEIVNDVITQTVLNNGNLSVDDVIDIYLNVIKANKRNVTNRLSYWANKPGMHVEREEYEELEEIFETTKRRERSYVPSADITRENDVVQYRGRILRADDPLNLLVGNATQCCQSLYDVGENSMRHGAMEDTGRIFVVEEIDESGRSRIVAQSWVWRNNGVLCFDNIEIPKDEQSELTYGKESEDIKKQKAIFEVYKGAAETILEKDNKMFEQLLRDKKITMEQYENLRLRLVTVGTGYNDLGILEDLGLPQLDHSDERGPIINSQRHEYNTSTNDGKPWIDSGIKHGEDGKQLILAGDPEEERQQDKNISIEEIPLEYMYKNPREVIKVKGSDINSVIDIIKEIEDKAYRNSQKIIQNSRGYEQLARQYEINNKNDMQVYVSADRDWYMLFVERKNDIYIADLASIGGLKSESHESKDQVYQGLEIMKSIYELMQVAAQQRKKVTLNATEDTSYPSILTMAKRGIVKIESDNMRDWELNNVGNDKIKIHDMTLTVDLEKVTKELEKINEIIEKRKDKDYER